MRLVSRLREGAAVRRFRSALWRELPFSARRVLISTARSVDHFEAWIRRTLDSLDESPAWLFVAVIGTVGIVLTVFLFFSLTRELLANGLEPAKPAVVQLVESAELPRRTDRELDTRLCLDDELLSEVSQAEFEFLGDVLPHRLRPVVETRPTPARLPTEPVELELFAEVYHTPLAPAAMPPETTISGRNTAEISPDEARRRLQDLPSEGWALALRSSSITRAEAAPEAYRPIRQNPDRPAIDADEAFWDDYRAWPTSVEAGFRLELRAPTEGRLESAARSEVLIQNIGQDAIRRLMVEENLERLDRVTLASPEGSLDGHLLRRELLRLMPNRERTFSLDWWPLDRQDRHHQVRAFAEVYVAGQTDVTGETSAPMGPEPLEEIPRPVRMAPPPRLPPPIPDPEPRGRTEPMPAVEAVEEPIAEPLPMPMPQPKSSITTRPLSRPSVLCRVATSATVTINRVAELQIEVINSGDVDLHQVKLWADLPPQVQHRHGRKLEYVIEALPKGARRSATLRLVGDEIGVAVAQFRVVTAEAAEASTVAEVRVEQPPRRLPASQPGLPKALPALRPVEFDWDTEQSCDCQGLPELSWNDAGADPQWSF
jgi:hypothetical protein